VGDITNPRLIWIKGILFLLLGLLASVLLIVHAPSMRVALLLCLAIWAFCRFYYFAFYVIEHYTNSDYRYSGLLSFLRHAVTKASAQCRNDNSRGGDGRPAGETNGPPPEC